MAVVVSLLFAGDDDSLSGECVIALSVAGETVIVTPGLVAWVVVMVCEAGRVVAAAETEEGVVMVFWLSTELLVTVAFIGSVTSGVAADWLNAIGA